MKEWTQNFASGSLSTHSQKGPQHTEEIAFDFFHRISQSRTPPNPWLLFLYLFIIIQFITAIYYTPKTDFMRYFFIIFLFSYYPESCPNDYIDLNQFSETTFFKIPGAVFIVVTFLVIFYFMLNLIFSDQSNFFNKSFSYISAILAASILEILMMPTLLISSKLTRYLLMLNSSNEEIRLFPEKILKIHLIVLAIFLYICYFLQTVVSYLFFLILSYNIYIPYNIYSSQKPYTFMISLSIQHLFSFFLLFSPFYPEWASMIFDASEILLLVYLLYLIIRIPPLYHFIQSAIFGEIVSMVYSIVVARFYDDKEIQWYFCFLSYVIFLVFTFSWYGLMQPFVRRLQRCLSYSGNYNLIDMTEPERKYFFTEIFPTISVPNLLTERFSHIKERDAIYLISIGLQYGCDMFLDMSFINYVLERFRYSRDLQRITLLSIIYFIPMQKRCRLLFNLYSKPRCLSFSDRFIIHQISRVEMMKQNKISHTREIDDLNRTVALSRQSFNDLCTVLSLKQIYLINMEYIYNSITICDFCWDTLIDKYPNLIDFHAEAFLYIIEAMSDFQKASDLKGKIIDIITDDGTDLSRLKENPCFLKLYKYLPFYFTKKALSYTGKFRIFQKKPIGALQIVSEMKSWELAADNCIKENISNFPEIRLAVYEATKNLRPKNSSHLMLFNIIFCILALFLSFLYFFYFQYNLVGQLANIPFIQSFQSTRLYNSASNILTLLCYSYYDKYVDFWFNYENIVKYQESIFHDNSIVSASIRTNISTIRFDIWNYSLLSVQQYQEALKVFNELNSDDIDMNQISSLMFDDVIPFYVCVDSIRVARSRISLTNIIMTLSHSKMLIVNDYPEDWITSNNRFCVVFADYSSISNDMNEVIYSFIMTNIALNDEKTGRNYRFGLGIAIVLFVIWLAIFLFIVVNYIQELTKFSKCLSSYDDTVKRNCWEQIHNFSQFKNDFTVSSYENMSDNLQLVFEGPNNVKYIILIGLSIVITFFSCLMFFVAGYMPKTSAENIYHVNTWATYNSLYRSQTIEAYESLIFSFILNQHARSSEPWVTNVTSLDFEMESCINLTKEASESTKQLFQYNNGSTSFFGIKAELDDFYLKDACDNHVFDFNGDLTDVLNKTMHYLGVGSLEIAGKELSVQSFACKSFAFKTFYYLAMVKDFIYKLKRNEEITPFDHLQLAHIYNILNNYVLPGIDYTGYLLNNMAADYDASYRSTLIWISVVSLVLIILSFGLVFILNLTFEHIFKGGIYVLRRIPPTEMVYNQKMVNLLLGTENSTTKQKSVTQSIFDHSSNMIFDVSYDGIIQGVNYAIYHNIMYSNEQILGQSIGIIFDESSYKMISEQMQAVISNEMQHVFDIDAICITARRNPIYVSISIIKIIDQIVLIVRNVNDIKLQEMQAEKEKKKSESLLNQILPPSIVLKIANGEKNISLTIPIATIMFADIVQFSRFSYSLSPQSILGMLSEVFDNFDKHIVKYSSLTKIKIIGDIYMCAAGLFDYETVKTEESANQVIRFGFDTLGVITDLNLKHNLDLSIRIGVNTGGPIIAGVLGTDKRVFDIIGDAINVAARLQTTSKHNQIHVSKDTMKYIVRYGYVCSKRRNTMLKGKGKTETFQVFDFPEDE